MAHLRVFLPNGEAQDIHIPGKRLILGRDEDYADYVLNDPAVSRMHAMIFLDGSSYLLRDMGSSGGTFLNRKKVREAVLNEGDSILIGSTVMEFRLQADLEEEALPEEAASSTISGIAARFRKLPAGMGLLCRILQIPPDHIFAPGDTINIGDGGIQFDNPFEADLRLVSLELELVWPDGRKKSFLGEIIQLHRARLCVKLHGIAREDYEHLLGAVQRSSWVTVVEPEQLSAP